MEKTIDANETFNETLEDDEDGLYEELKQGGISSKKDESPKKVTKAEVDKALNA